LGRLDRRTSWSGREGEGLSHVVRAAKTRIRGAAPRARHVGTAAQCGSDVGGGIRIATLHPPRVRARVVCAVVASNRVRISVEQGIVAVEHPLREISGQVEVSVAPGARPVASDRSRRRAVIIGKRRRRIRRPPRVPAIVRPACRCVLPFGFRRQASAVPSAEGEGFVPSQARFGRYMP
jgi:hypothetical protein